MRAVVFDLDGTLFDHVESARHGLGSWLSQLGTTLTADLELAWFEAEERHIESWRTGAISWAEQRRRRLRDFLPLIGPVPGEADELDRQFVEGYLSAYEAAWTGYGDVDDVLAQLTERGFVLAILTNGTEEQQREKLARLELLDRVGPLFTAEGLGVAKPDPESFRLVCRALGLPPGEVLYVGDDFEIDVLAARAAGLKAVYLSRSSGSARKEDAQIATLDGLLDLVVRSW